jgi:NhaP-type Na+/H+ or K+/H+ antiporter
MVTEQQLYFLTIGICFTIGYAIYKAIETIFSAKTASTVAHTIMIIEVVYLCTVLNQDSYSYSIIELIFFGIFFTQMIKTTPEKSEQIYH